MIPLNGYVIIINYIKPKDCIIDILNIVNGENKMLCHESDQLFQDFLEELRNISLWDYNYRTDKLNHKYKPIYINNCNAVYTDCNSDPIIVVNEQNIFEAFSVLQLEELCQTARNTARIIYVQQNSVEKQKIRDNISKVLAN